MPVKSLVLFSDRFIDPSEKEPVLVEQDDHPDGVIFGLVDLDRPMVSTRTVLAVEQSKAKSMAMGLRYALRCDTVCHPWVWPDTRPKTVRLVDGKVVSL